MADKPLQDLVSRLEAERLEADRRYNDALTALDAAIRAFDRTPPTPPAARYDASQLPRVNEHWRIVSRAARPEGAGFLRDRLHALVWRIVGPALEAQEQFNAALVDHLNRNVAAHRDASLAIADLREAVARDRDTAARFHTSLILYLQTITEYVDAKDRALGGPELREQIVLANERSLAALRAADRPETRGQKPEAQPTTYNPQPTTDFSYVGFEDRFRGSQDAIRERVKDYVPLFSGASGDVLDVGCGRGELLALLKEAGIAARGIDVNGEMAAMCRERGLDVQQAAAAEYLESLPDASLGGLTGIQVVEHLDPAYLSRFLSAAFHKLRPGAPIVLETINPACWMAFFEAYLRDLTHAQPLHPETLKFLVQASGFSSADVQYRSPVQDADRLDTIEAPADTPPALRDAIAAVNAHARKLNARLFSYMDYAVIARR